VSFASAGAAAEQFIIRHPSTPQERRLVGGALPADPEPGLSHAEPNLTHGIGSARQSDGISPKRGQW
jgi:hypothetical protein